MPDPNPRAPEFSAKILNLNFRRKFVFEVTHG